MKPVTVYVTSTCPYCHNAKRLLQKKGIPFESVDLSDQPELRQEVSEKAGMRTVPMVFIGGDCVGGYTDLADLERSGELDRLLAA